MGDPAVDSLKEQGRDFGLTYLIEKLVGGAGGATIVVGILNAFRAEHKAAMAVALKQMQRLYSDTRIGVLGQQVAGNLPEHDIREILKRTGGTVWIADGEVPKDAGLILFDGTTGLAMCAWFHPDPQFSPRHAIRVYREVPPVCTGQRPFGQSTRDPPQLRAARY
jgi:hypothetical protein